MIGIEVEDGRDEIETRLKASIPVIDTINTLSGDLHRNFKSMRTKGINLRLAATRLAIYDPSLTVVVDELYKNIDNQEELLKKIDGIILDRMSKIIIYKK